MSAAQPVLQRGIIKQVLSGDTVIIRGQPKGGPPPEKTFGLAHVIAPKLARRPPAKDESIESKDEPFAWEAREFLRKKLIGMEVCFQVEYKTTRGVECGYIYLGQDANGENVSESLVVEGLVDVKHSIKESEKQKKLLELEEQAKTSCKGKWGPDASTHIREIKWNLESPRNFMDSLHSQPITAIIEHVRDGATVRAFLLTNSCYYHVTVMMSGIRCPMFKIGDDGNVQGAELFAEEAKFFTESRLLQREVEIILESVNNNNFYGSVLHPKGSIAELLLKEGFARCIDWSISFVTGGAEKLRAAEKVAKEKRIRIWKDYAPSGVQIEAKDKEFIGKVVEVVNADALVLKMADNTLKKIFLASIRPPRQTEAQPQEASKDAKGKPFRPLYDIPYMYEAREFLRKKLVGKKVNVIIDYIQPASNSFPEKTCCTVTIAGMNVAEALVSKGLATVVRYRQDDDQRSSHYDELLAAETKANKSSNGLHSKKEIPIHRVADISGDYAKAKQFLPFLQRAGRSDAVVEYVASGSRLRLYIPRETCLITFLLAGINCPRPTRPGPGGTTFEGELYGEEAMVFTKELCLQREVEVEVENMDKAGNFIGWLWVDGTNLSVALVEDSLASVHFSAERSSHFRALQNAEDSAKRRKEKIWSTYEEPKEVEVKDDIVERKINYKSIVITNVLTTSVTNMHFHAQHADQGPQLEQLMDQLRQDFAAHPPLTGAYTPKKGELCAAKFTDNEWYRAKIEKITGSEVLIYYIDYGNRETTKSSKLASLPSNFHALPPMAQEYALACVTIPSDHDDQQDALQVFYQETQEKTLLLNVEYRVGGIDHVTLLLSDTKEDLAKQLISEGFFIVEERKEKRLQKLISEFKAAQETARKNRVNLWRYGDFMADDAKEFGFKR